MGIHVKYWGCVNNEIQEINIIWKMNFIVGFATANNQHHYTCLDELVKNSPKIYTLDAPFSTFHLEKGEKKNKNQLPNWISGKTASFCFNTQISPNHDEPHISPAYTAAHLYSANTLKKHSSKLSSRVNLRIHRFHRKGCGNKTYIYLHVNWRFSSNYNRTARNGK